MDAGAGVAGGGLVDTGAGVAGGMQVGGGAVVAFAEGGETTRVSEGRTRIPVSS